MNVRQQLEGGLFQARADILFHFRLKTPPVLGQVPVVHTLSVLFLFLKLLEPLLQSLVLFN